MRTDVRATSKLAAAILLFFNFLVMFFSALLFALSLWIISSPTTLSVTLKALANSTINALLPTEVLSVQLGIAIAVIAVFLFFVSFMGFYGAINRSPFLLFMYSTLNLLLLLLECALLYYFSSSLIEKGLQEQDGQWTHALRLVYRCCEYNTTDFTVSKLPWSCCDVESNRKNCTAFNKYQQDCKETITAWLNRYQVAIYATLAVVHVVLSSCSVMRRVSSASRSHT